MFVTVCNKEYLIGFEVMLKSLIDNNPRVINDNLPFVIITNDLNPEDLVTSRKIYNNIHIKRYDESKYSQIEELKKQQMAFGDYTKYEIFSLTEFKKIIFLDSDTIILGNIDYLIDFEESFGCVRELFIDQYNTGVMVIGNEYLNPKITEDLINLTNVYGITEHLDQDIINNYFIDVITPIPLEYNYLKIYSKQIFQNTGLPDYVKIIHYVVKKPWQQKPLVFLEEGTLWTERYWFEYYSKILKYKLNEL
jgi:lipopolysaccharide biosynthesis glycosyltransferase